MFFFKFWRRFHEIILALLITFIILGFYYLGLWFRQQGWDYHYDYQDEYLVDVPSPRPDISAKLSTKLYAYSLTASTLILFLSLFTTPVAAYVSARNHRLAVPIRLLAMAENVNKFLYSFLVLGASFCRNVTINQKRCPKWLGQTFDFADLYLISTFHIDEIAMYCQLMISVNRFIAVSFDGLYFRHTRKWPIIQMIIPYLLRVGIWYLQDWTYMEFLDFWSQHYVTLFPQFLLCGLDFVTSWRLKKLRKDGKASRAETLLMIQMLSNSGSILLYQIFSAFAQGIIIAFYGVNLEFLIAEILGLMQAFLFLFFHECYLRFNAS